AAKPAVTGSAFRYYHRKDGPNPGALETLPLPAWDLFPMDAYWQSEVRAGGGDVQRERYAVMVSTRGCPHVCFYCTSPLMGGYKGYRKRTNEDVVREIAWLRDEFGVEEIQFLDDNFFVSAPRVKDLCRRLAAEFPEISFSVPAGTEVNALDEEMIDLLAAANFHRITLAIESGNPDIQANQINKHVDLARVPEVVKAIRARGMEVRGFLMIGFPGESRESILHTADYAMSLELDDFALSVVTPLPGTPVHDEAVAKGLLAENFNPDDIRYSVSTIRIDGMTADEIEAVRRETWRRHQEAKRARAANAESKVHRRFETVADYAAAGFSDKGRVGFSGFSETTAAE
ncbi:MAG: radical SAM protein, partial [Alphaproteobacteria bacterium]